MRRVGRPKGLLVLVVGLMGGTAMEASGDQAAELVRQTESADRSERLEALHKLTRVRPARVGASFAAALSGLGPSDVEAALRLEVVANATAAAPAISETVARWVLSQRTASPARAPTGPEGERRALVAAGRALARGAGADVEAALVRLAEAEDREVARTALAVADERAQFDARRHVDALIILLARPDLEAADRVLSLLAKAKDGRATGPVMRALERFAEANPRTEAPTYAATLRALTGQSFGDAPGPWLAWWKRQN